MSPEPSDPYNLTEDHPIPASRAKPSPISAYPQRHRAAPVQEESDDEFSFLRDRVVPIILLIAGFALRIAQIPVDHSLAGGSLVASLAIGVCQMILTAAIMLGGVYISARILEANFGRLDSAILKLCAIAVFVWAAGAFAMSQGQYHPGVERVMVGLIFLVQFFLFSALFPLDLQETILTVCICGLLEAGAGFVVFS